MKRLLAMAALAAALVPLGQAQASHSPREVKGTLTLPAPNAPSLGIVTRHARCAYLLAGDQSQGIFGWVVDFGAEPDDPATPWEGDGSHTFTLKSGTSGANVDVVFYVDLGTCDNSPAPTTVGDPFAGPGDEAGTIPPTATKAIIVNEGPVLNAAFTFAIA